MACGRKRCCCGGGMLGNRRASRMGAARKHCGHPTPAARQRALRRQTRDSLQCVRIDPTPIVAEHAAPEPQNRQFILPHRWLWAREPRQSCLSSFQRSNKLVCSRHHPQPGTIQQQLWVSIQYSFGKQIEPMAQLSLSIAQQRWTCMVDQQRNSQFWDAAHNQIVERLCNLVARQKPVGSPAVKFLNLCWRTLQPQLTPQQIAKQLMKFVPLPLCIQRT